MESGEGRILLAFYGDDFTGAMATAEALTSSGIPTVVFTQPPTLSFLAERFPQVRAVGVAGTARMLPVGEVEDVLSPIFKTMKGYRAPIFLYKVCSTFDSSRDVGNIGRAIEVGKAMFRSDLVPVLVAAPRLGRFTVFGHHFAALGQEAVYRLDRHPSMAHHPATPMQESDLRLHLAEQTDLESGLIDVRALERGEAHVRNLLDGLAESAAIVLFDCLFERHLMLVCDLVWQRASQEKPIFFVGSQEVGYGLGKVWQDAGLASMSRTHSDDERTSSDRPLFVISGSCATVTVRQIRWAIDNGFAGITVHLDKLLDPTDRSAERERVIKTSVSSLQQGISVVVHTAAAGTDDPETDSMRERTDELWHTSRTATNILGDVLGEIALEIIQRSRVRRVVVAGGDTAGKIQKYLGIQALQVAKSIGIAAPLCYVYSRTPYIDGLRMAFKGGQIGSEDYFGAVRAAQAPSLEAAALGRSYL